MKKFFKKTEGFTLVELIVVIAILGILAGVGTVGYSGYIKKANMAADQQLIAGVKQAVELAAIGDPKSFTGTVAVILSKDGISFSPAENNPAQKAVEAVYGSTAGLKLKSDWGGAGNVVTEAIEYFAGIPADDPLRGVYDGTVQPSFKDDIDDLFGTMRDTAVLVGGKTGTNGANLLAGAADATVGDGAIGAEAFASAWATASWSNEILMGTEGDNYNEDYIKDNRDKEDGKAFMNMAMANAAVIKARNTSIATYLRDNGHPEYYEAISNYCVGTSSSIPGDLVGDAMNGSLSDVSEKIGAYVVAQGGTFDATDFRKAVMNVVIGENGYFAKKAEEDAKAYYAMLSVVDNVNIDGEKSDATYWDEMAGAVSLYGSIVNGETSLDELQDIYGAANIPNGAVMMTVMGKNVGAAVKVNPQTVFAK